MKTARVEFRERGRNPRLYVAEDGTLLSPLEKPPLLAVGPTFAGLPVKVQTALRDRLRSGGEITRVVEQRSESVVTGFRIEVRDGSSRRVLEFAPDGRLVSDEAAHGRHR